MDLGGGLFSQQLLNVAIDFLAQNRIKEFHTCREARGIWPYDRPAT